MRRFNPREPTDQQAQYLTSVHGKRAAQGDEKVATCASCHGAHGVRHVADPASPVSPMHVVETCARCHADPAYMKDYDIPTDQLAKYKESAHGRKRLVERDPGAPACNTCHGNHGAAPPGVSSVANVCGKCHQSQVELFAPSGHAKAFAKKGIAGCTTCHGNHAIPPPDDRFLSAEPGALCTRCHTPRDKCDQAAHVMSAGMAALVDDIGKAELTLDAADGLGMDVAKPRFELAGAKDALVRARVSVHAFAPTAFADVIQEGREVAAGVAAAGHAALDEHAYRRKGLAVAAACLLAFAALLAVKARRLETSGPAIAIGHGQEEE
jgi:predicted CXXCH cytochrome family protein